MDNSRKPSYYQLFNYSSQIPFVLCCYQDMNAFCLEGEVGHSSVMYIRIQFFIVFNSHFHVSQGIFKVTQKYILCSLDDDLFDLKS